MQVHLTLTTRKMWQAEPRSARIAEIISVRPTIQSILEYVLTSILFQRSGLNARHEPSPFEQFRPKLDAILLIRRSIFRKPDAFPGVIDQLRQKYEPTSAFYSQRGTV